VALVLVGDGPQRETLEGRAPPGVYFTGYLTGTDLSEAYASGDVFAFPSDTETFGNVVMEALASGLPVVAPDKGGVTDSVLPGQNGFLFEPGNPRDLAGSLMALLQDEGLRVSLSQRAREFALERSWSSVLDRLFRDYSEALAGHPTATRFHDVSGREVVDNAAAKR
jgi:glycosyltransferase involved in cell wall biosynthesis